MNIFALSQSRMPSPPPAPQTAASASTARTLSRHGSSNGSFVCNVSDDEVIERDVDLEIEARIRSGTLPSNEQETEDQNNEMTKPYPAQLQASMASMRGPTRRSSTAQPPNKSTLSQRMLSALQRKKTQTATRSKRSGSVLLEVVQAEHGTIPEMPRSGSNHSMGTDIDGLVVPDLLYDPSQDPVDMSDDESPNITHSVTTSCKDRLEARISERKLQNKSSLSARSDTLTVAPVDGNEMSALFTNRRTYPAESAKNVDPRFSDNLLESRFESSRVSPESRPAPRNGTYYQQYGSQQYSNQHHHHQESQGRYMDPTVENLDATKSLPVAFHFQGNNGRAQTLAPPSDFRNSRQPHASMNASSVRREHAPPPQVRQPPRRDGQYVTLSQSVDQIEQVVDGLENCFNASSFSSLAMVALRELELLHDSTKQIRTTGITLILAEIGRPQSQMLGPFRQLVARAANLQNRIEMLIQRIRTMF